MKKVKIIIQSKDFLIEDERDLTESKITPHIRRFKRIKHNIPKKGTRGREKRDMLSQIKFKVTIQ